jgi:hypothetical protein
MAGTAAAVILIVLTFTVISVSAQVATGGSYTLNQAVVAGGGGTSSDAVNNNYKVEGTSGQPAAGTFSNVGSYSIRGGFWAANPFAPTAAGVSVSGRVLGINNEGLRNITVILAGGALLTPRRARTNTFGNFTFEDVEAGQVYTVSIQNKKYGFPQESQVFSLMDSISGIVFQAAWEN